MLRRLFLFVLILLFLAIASYTGYLYWLDHLPRESIYDPQIVAIARDNGVDPFLIRALIWRESKFDPNTHGAADEHGLMQVTPEVGQTWARENKIENYKDDDLYDPETNIRVGTWYLNRALKQWSQTDDPIPFALAQYNAGRKNALKWVDPVAPLSHTSFIDRITYPTTRLYVEKIMAKREEYRTEFANNRWYKDVAAAGSPVSGTQ